MQGREAELPTYTFEFLLDYGAYREFKRHRMQTYISQTLTVANGYVLPELIGQAGLESVFVEAMEVSQEAYQQVYLGHRMGLLVAQYLVTHAHKRRVLSQMSLRECYHLFKLRTSSQAHFTIRAAMQRALELAQEVHPLLFSFLKLRD